MEMKTTYKMKRVALIICIIGSSLYTAFAQAQPGTEDSNARAKLEAARIAMITERLNLTPEQAEKFWPIYNQFAQERRAMQQEVLKARQGLDMNNLSEEQSQQLVDAQLKYRQDNVNLENKYAEMLTKVITAKQLVALKKAEDDFRAMILRRLEQRKRQQMQRQQMLNERERRIQQGNN